MPQTDITNCILEYQPSEFDSNGVALGWTALIEDYTGREFKPEGLTNGLPGRFRVACTSEGGTTVGDVVTVRRVGFSKTELRLPAGWYDDPPLGTGPLWTCTQTYRRLATGAGYYTYDRIEMTEVKTQVDVDDVVEWTTPKNYLVGDRVTVLLPVIDSDTVSLQIVQLYECNSAHLSVAEDDGPTINSGGFWDRVGIYNIVYSEETPEPAGPTTEPPGIDEDTTIMMDIMEPNTHVNSPADRPNEPGEYKMARDTATGWRGYNVWEDMISQPTLLALSLWDKNQPMFNTDGTLRNAPDQWNRYFFTSLKDSPRSDLQVLVRYSTNEWILFDITNVGFSSNDFRCNLHVTPITYNQSDLTREITTTEYPQDGSFGEISDRIEHPVDVDFIFNFTAPTVG